MADIKPYTINVPESALGDLKARLKLAKFPDELDEAAWDLGAPLADVKRLTAYWRDDFDWRKAEASLNQLPQFTTGIQCDGFESLEIHFLHKQSTNPNAIPLLFVHGWPGSFIESTKLINELPQGGDGSPAFHFVALSLPNFGFSQGPRKRGFAIEQYAETGHRLMQKLGYKEYVTQGGDWGYYITRAMSLLYPESCKATHINFDQGMQPSFTAHPLLAIEHALKPYTAREQVGQARTKWFLEEGSGYRLQQATKPQTLGYGLADSPVALLGWIYEKLHDWTDAYPWTDDEICAWIALYWFSTAGPAASLRIYFEAVHTWEKKSAGKPRVTRERTAQWIPHVKLGMSHFPKELRVLPDTWMRTQGNIVFEKHHDKGGHFAAWENPQAIVGDLREMFGKGGGAYGVVPGKSGY